MKAVLAALALLASASAAYAECVSGDEEDCKTWRHEKHHTHHDYRSHGGKGAGAGEGGSGEGRAGGNYGGTGGTSGDIVVPNGGIGGNGGGDYGGGPSQKLFAMRAYLSQAQIPPSDVAGYGLVVLTAKPTEGTRAKLERVCKAFVQNFPKSIDSSRPLPEQMITIWPVEAASLQKAEDDDCSYNLQHYDLEAAQDAMADARSQGAKLSGQGPFLLAWAPSSSRGVKDKLVLIGDFSPADTAEAIDDKFNTWKTKVVEDPSLWRDGFTERMRIAIREFVDKRGGDALDALKQIVAKAPD